MKLLALDTSADASSVAIYDAKEGLILAEERIFLERGHAEILFDQVARVQRHAGIELASIDRFAVTTGPGSFTGVRIGLSAARGFALASGRPITGIGTLEVIAAGAPDAPGRLTIAALDARRGEVYAQVFALGKARMGPFAATPGDAARAIISAANGAELIAVGSGAELIRDALRRLGAPCDVAPGDGLPHAGALARIAAARAPETAPPIPLYIRAPDAKLPSAP